MALSSADNPVTCKGEYNIGEIEGDYIYFRLYDKASDRFLDSKLKFTIAEFETLEIIRNFNRDTNILKYWFYNTVNRNSSANGLIQPMYHIIYNGTLTDKSLTSILAKKYLEKRGKKRLANNLAYFNNGVKFDYTTGNYWFISIEDYKVLEPKPVSLLSPNN